MKSSFQNISAPPYLYTAPSLSRGAIYTVFALLPQLVLLGLLGDFDALAIIGITVLGCITAEVLDNRIRKCITLTDGSIFITGILTGMFLPSGFPLWIAFLISFGSILLAKEFFGGIGCSWISPVMVSAAVAYICAPVFFPATLITEKVLESTGAPFPALMSGGFIPIVSDRSITGFLNGGFFQRLGINFPEGYVTLFWDTGSLIPAFRFNILILAASIFLISSDVMDWIIPVCYFFVYALLVWCFSLLPAGGSLWSGDILFALLTGGTFFCGFFALQYYGTVPLSKTGKVLYGVLSGIIAFLLCGAGDSPISAIFTVLIMNSLSPLIQTGEEKLFNFMREREIRQRVMYGK